MRKQRPLSIVRSKFTTLLNSSLRTEEESTVSYLKQRFIDLHSKSCMTSTCGYEFLVPVHQSSFYDCTNIWGSSNFSLITISLDCSTISTQESDIAKLQNVISLTLTAGHLSYGCMAICSSVYMQHAF